MASLLLVSTAVTSEARNNNNNRNQARVTKGAPAKGPSDLSFSETVNDRISALGTPDDQKAAREQEAARKAKRLQLEARERRAEAQYLDRLREQLTADPASIKRVDTDGRTLLHLAALAGYPDSVKYLLANGASTTVKDAGGATPADLALRIGRADIAAAIQHFKP